MNALQDAQLLRTLQAKFEEITFYALCCISLRSMCRVLWGGIIHSVGP